MFKSTLPHVIGILLLAYWAIAATVFEFRHPKANRTVFITECWAVLQFETLERFQ